MAASNESLSDRPLSNQLTLERQRRIRRNVWWLAAVALAFYVGFIVMSVSAARG